MILTLTTLFVARFAGSTHNRACLHREDFLAQRVGCVRGTLGVIACAGSAARQICWRLCGCGSGFGGRGFDCCGGRFRHDSRLGRRFQLGVVRVVRLHAVATTTDAARLVGPDPVTVVLTRICFKAVP